LEITGELGLVELERAYQAGHLYQMALLDVMMPNMDGLELTEKIRAFADKDLAATPLLIMSSSSDADHRERAGQLGVLRSLNKPVKQIGSA